MFYIFLSTKSDFMVLLSGFDIKQSLFSLKRELTETIIGTIQWAAHLG